MWTGTKHSKSRRQGRSHISAKDFTLKELAKPCTAWQQFPSRHFLPVPCVSRSDRTFLKGSVYVNNTSSLPFKTTKKTYHNAQHHAVLMNVFFWDWIQCVFLVGGEKCTCRHFVPFPSARAAICNCLSNVFSHGGGGGCSEGCRR